MLRRRILNSVATISTSCTIQRSSRRVHERPPSGGMPPRGTSADVGATGPVRGGGTGELFVAGMRTSASAPARRRLAPPRRAPRMGEVRRGRWGDGRPAGCPTRCSGTAAAPRPRRRRPPNRPAHAGDPSGRDDRARRRRAPMAASMSRMVKVRQEAPFGRPSASPAGTPVPNPMDDSVHAAIAPTVTARSCRRISSTGSSWPTQDDRDTAVGNGDRSGDHDHRPPTAGSQAQPPARTWSA